MDKVLKFSLRRNNNIFQIKKFYKNVFYVLYVFKYGKLSDNV